MMMMMMMKNDDELQISVLLSASGTSTGEEFASKISWVLLNHCTQPQINQGPPTLGNSMNSDKCIGMTHS